MFIASGCDLDRLRPRFMGRALAVVDFHDLVTVGFEAFEVSDPELPFDRHCILRPDATWNRSEYRKRAHALAEKARVILPPSSYHS